MEAKEKMSLGKKVAWALTIVYFAATIFSYLYSTGGSFSGAFCTIVCAFCVIRFGPAGIWLFWVAVALIGVISFPIQALSSMLPVPREHWYLFFGCVVFLLASLLCFSKWNFFPDHSPFDELESQAN